MQDILTKAIKTEVYVSAEEKSVSDLKSLITHFQSESDLKRFYFF